MYEGESGRFVRELVTADSIGHFDGRLGLAPGDKAPRFRIDELLQNWLSEGLSPGPKELLVLRAGRLYCAFGSDSQAASVSDEDNRSTCPTRSSPSR